MIGRLLEVAPYAAGFIAAGIIVLVVGCLIAAAGTIEEAPDYEGRHRDDEPVHQHSRACPSPICTRKARR